MKKLIFIFFVLPFFSANAFAEENIFTAGCLPKEKTSHEIFKVYTTTDRHPEPGIHEDDFTSMREGIVIGQGVMPRVSYDIEKNIFKYGTEEMEIIEKNDNVIVAQKINKHEKGFIVYTVLFDTETERAIQTKLSTHQSESAKILLGSLDKIYCTY